MKNKVLILFIFIALLFTITPFVSFAESFEIDNNEVKISLDSNIWTVFTRDNLEEKKGMLKKLGTTAKQMQDTMSESNAYIVAIKNKQKNREEILVRIQKNNYINNINTLSEEELKALKNGINEEYGSEIDELECELLDLGEYKWIRLTGRYDKEHFVVQYFTICNGKEYLISAQKVVGYTAEDKEELETIVRSTKINVNEKLKDNDLEGYIKSQQDRMTSSTSIQTKIFSGIVIALAVIAALYIKNRKHKSKVAKLASKR